MKVTLDVCDQCHCIIADEKKHGIIHTFSPHFYTKDFNIEAPQRKKRIAKRKQTPL